LPRQQYWSPPSTPHADPQPTTAPPAWICRTLGQSTALAQPAWAHPVGLIGSLVAPAAMLMYIGRLDPSTMLTS
jgi:hypothetical protein